MITIEIYSQVLDSKYDFVIDEYAEVETIIDDVVRMMCQRTRNNFSGNISELILYDVKNRIVFSPKNTLKDYGIKTGDTVYLV